MQHMQSTRERDDYVTIIWKNIQEDRKKNFKRREEYSMYPFPYDYNSILHYPQRAFSKNGKLTIIAKGNSREPLTRKNELSAIEKAKLRYMYCSNNSIINSYK